MLPSECHKYHGPIYVIQLRENIHKRKRKEDNNIKVYMLCETNYLQLSQF